MLDLSRASTFSVAWSSTSCYFLQTNPESLCEHQGEPYANPEEGLMWTQEKSQREPSNSPTPKTALSGALPGGTYNMLQDLSELQVTFLSEPYLNPPVNFIFPLSEL